MSALNDIRSGKTKRQLPALASLEGRNQGELFTMPGLITCLIEHGICSDNALVRARSLKLMRVIYRVRVVYWGEVRNAVVSELSSPEDAEPLERALELVKELPQRELLVFISSEEVISSIKGLCTLPNDFLKMRLCAVRHVAEILLKTWSLVSTG